MKTPITIVLGLTLSISCYGQSNSTTTTPPTSEIGRAENVPLSKEKIEELNGKIVAIDDHLKAIQTKREYILNDPELVKKANETGWFEDMKATELSLNEKKKALQERLARGY